MQRSQLSLRNGTTKTSKQPAKVIKGLFERFAAIWGDHWCKSLDGREKLAQREWAEALAPYQESQIAKAVEIARFKHAWPLRISEFVELCNNAGNGNLINHADASDIAEKKVRKKICPKNILQINAERDAISALALKIVKQQNDKGDVVFCFAQGCHRYLIMESEINAEWYCKEHDHEH